MRQHGQSLIMERKHKRHGLVYDLVVRCRSARASQRSDHTPRMLESGVNMKIQTVQYFLFVLMCPTCPQLAHFRVVDPVGLRRVVFGLASSASPSCDPSGDPEVPFFALTRASRRAWFL